MILSFERDESYYYMLSKMLKTLLIINSSTIVNEWNVVHIYHWRALWGFAEDTLN